MFQQFRLRNAHLFSDAVALKHFSSLQSLEGLHNYVHKQGIKHGKD